jgi:hypothetical protein
MAAADRLVTLGGRLTRRQSGGRRHSRWRDDNETLAHIHGAGTQVTLMALTRTQE